MALINLIFNRKTRGQIGGVTIDATLEEDHSLLSDITENPVEDGANITDHVHLKPAELVIEGCISDTPINFSLLNAPFVTGVINLNSQPQTRRSIEAYNQLVELRNKRIPFEVVTGLRVYRNMILSTLRVNRNASKANAIFFTAELKEIRIVGTSLGIDEGGPDLISSEEVSDISSNTKNFGQKVPLALDSIKEANLLSNVSSIFNLIRSLPLNA